MDLAQYKEAVAEFEASSDILEEPTKPSPMTSTQGDGADKCLQAPPPGSPGHLGESSASQTRLPSYKKTGGAADGAGNDYEHKMLSLVFLRMLAAGYQFQLASNMEAAGLFDDIVLRYRKHSNDPWLRAYLQLKHKQKKTIPKPALLGISGDFSLVKYCDSYVSVLSDLKEGNLSDEQKFVIFTNASVNDSLVYEVEADPLVDTGGKAVSFKAGGEVFKELCERVDIKEAFTELHSQVVDLSEEEAATRIAELMQSAHYQNFGITSFIADLMKTPTRTKLNELLKKLELVKDKDTYASFLEKLRVYTNQAHESELDAKIKEELGKVWKCYTDLEAGAMLQALQAKVKSWWQKDNFYLTQDSPLWLDIIKSQTESVSKSTIGRLTKFHVQFGDSALQILFDRIHKMPRVGGILNLRVTSRTAASSLRVHQALAKFSPNEIVMHVNVKTLLEREDDVLSAWASRWCRLLVVECDDELDQSQAERIGDKILKVIGSGNYSKIIVLIAPKKHELNLRLCHDKRYKRFHDHFVWNDLTEKSMVDILSNKVVLNGTQTSLTLSDLVDADDRLFNKFDLEVISKVLQKDVSCGKDLDEDYKFFVDRRLKNSADGRAFVVNSLGDVVGKVALLVAEPGMGKSTLITHLASLAKKEDLSALVVHVKLNDCMQYLKDINVSEVNEREAKKFLEHAAFKCGNNLEKLIFGALLHKLVVFVDGVDEVCPHYEQQVFKLLSFLKNMKFRQLWVASRPVFQTKLETTLEVRALQLVAFLEQDRIELFNKLCTERFSSASSEKCSEVAESLLTFLNNSLGRDNPILGVPLMAVMVAETFQEQLFSAIGPSSTFQENKRLDITNLYKIFVKRKFDIFCVEKKKTLNREQAANLDVEETLMRQIHHHHRLAALRVLFSREEIDGLQFEGKGKFDQDLATYLQEVSDGRDKLGIIDNVVDDIPHFVHRSFAEYFAASWLALHFKDNKRFIERIVFDPAYKLVSEMFHHSLAENHLLHVAVVNRDLEAIKSFLSSKSNKTNVNALDAGGRTPLHLAVLLSGTARHPDYVTIVKYLVQKQNARLDVADEVFGWSPLRYAECSGAWKALKLMLDKVGVDSDLTKKDEDLPKPDASLMLDAARDASVLVVRYLVEKRGGDLHCRGTEGETMIHRAAEGGNIATLKYLHEKRQSSSTSVEDVLNLNASNNQGLIALQEAAQRGAYNVVAFLLELQASFQVSASANVSQVQLNSSLLCSAFAGSLEFVKNLVGMGASVNHQDNKGHTAAWVAMERKHSQVMDWLLLCGSKDGHTPLHVACEKGDLEMVTFILSRGDDIEAKGWLGRTPLMAAVANNKLAVTELLLEKRVNLEARDKVGNTPLQLALLRGYKQAVELLLSYGAEVTPLVATAIRGDLDDVKNIVATFNTESEGMSKAEYINMKDTGGRTLVHHIARNGKADIISHLISQGGDQQNRDNHNNTPIHLAAEYKHVDTVRVLLAAIDETDRAAAVNSCDKDGDSVLMCGAVGGCVKCVGLLVEAGGKMSQVDNNGWTSLMAASGKGHLDVVKYLLNNFNDEKEGKSKLDYIKSDNSGWTSIHLAAITGKSDIISYLISEGGDHQSCDKNNNTPIHLAASYKHVDAVRVLLAAYNETDRAAAVNKPGKDGYSVLMCGAWGGCLESVRLLVEAGGKLSQVNNNGRTSLMEASDKGHLDVVKYLVNNFNDEKEGKSMLDYINQSDNSGRTSIHLAAIRGKSDIISYLISQGGDHQSCDKNNNTPIHLAAHNKHVDAVRVLLAAYNETDRAAAVNKPGIYGYSVLMCGALGGCVKCVGLLVEAGGKMSQVDDSGWTSLMAASDNGYLDVAKYILNNFNGEKEGKSKLYYINQSDNSGLTSIHLAAIRGKSDIISYLISQGGDHQSCDKINNTPIHSAAIYNQVDAVRVLLTALHETDRAAAVNSCDKDGDSVLMCGALGGCVKCVGLLVEAGGKMSQVNNNGRTSLMRASDKGHLDVVKYLLNNFSDEKEGKSKLDYINQSGNSGRTSIHLAAIRGKSDIISYLISQGGDHQSCDKNNNTPIHLAAELKHVDTVRVLLAAYNETDRAAAVNKPGIYGYSVLMCGAFGGCLETVRLLVEAGGKMSQVNDSGRTSLMIAVDKDRTPIVSFLLESFDAKSEGMTLKDFINMKNKDGGTALDMSSPECRKEIENFLAKI